MRLAHSILALAAFMALNAEPQAVAQTNAVLQHYRAYTAALQSGDLQTAATEAQAALDASVTRDGDGGRTAVLALNLASVHLMAGRPEQARPAAQRALELARVGAEGVDPAMAEVVFARAALAVDANAAAAAQLNAALAAPAAQTLPVAEIYAASAQLGNWAIANEDFDLAQSAWTLAGAHPEGSEFGEAYGLGLARTSEAIAIIMGELNHGSRRIGVDDGIAAHALLGEAVRALLPLTVESPELELTVAQRTFSTARVWLLALRSKQSADGRRLPDVPREAQGDADGLNEVGPVDLSRPRCMMRLIAEPLPRYPTTTQVGAVMVFLRVNADGEIVSHQIVARAGSDQFAEAVDRVAGRWRIMRQEEGSAPNCRMESSLLAPVNFTLR